MKCVNCSLLILSLPSPVLTQGTMVCPQCSTPLPSLLGRLDRRQLETYLHKAERVMPFLRKHIKEVADNPTKLHLDQVRASLGALRQCLDYIQFHLQPPGGANV